MTKTFKRNLIIVIIIILSSSLLGLVSCSKELPDTYQGDTLYIEIIQYYDNELSYMLNINNNITNYDDYVQLKYHVSEIPEILYLYSNTDLVYRKYYDIAKSKKVLVYSNKNIKLN